MTTPTNFAGEKRMEARQEAVPERAANGWPFPQNASPVERSIIEGYAPISPEFEREIAAIKEKMAATFEEKEKAASAMRLASLSHDASVRDYQSVIRRLNEWRAALAKAGAA